VTEARAPTVATIGVYGWTLEAFLDALRAAGVALVLDVRQRRGVRGSEYAWANAVRLQAALAEAGIGYRHRKELAPTTELRDLQYREDERQGVGPAGVTSALLCVERDSEACHRSLIADRLAADYGMSVVHLRP